MARTRQTCAGVFYARMRAARLQILVDELARHGGNKTHAAQALGLNRTYLARLLRTHGGVMNRNEWQPYRVSNTGRYRALRCACGASKPSGDSPLGWRWRRQPTTRGFPGYDAQCPECAKKTAVA